MHLIFFVIVLFLQIVFFSVRLFFSTLTPNNNPTTTGHLIWFEGVKIY
jgi:hypothetical protein